MQVDERMHTPVQIVPGDRLAFGRVHHVLVRLVAEAIDGGCPHFRLALACDRKGPCTRGSLFDTAILTKPSTERTLYSGTSMHTVMNWAPRDV